MLVKPRETAFASADGFETAAIAFSGVIRYGNDTAAPATAPIWRKRRRERNTSATSENTGLALRLLISSRCSFLNTDLRGLPIAASCHWPRGKDVATSVRSFYYNFITQQRRDWGVPAPDNEVERLELVANRDLKGTRLALSDVSTGIIHA